MSDHPHRMSAWPIWAWSMVALVSVAVAISIVGGVFSKRLILDIASFWPGLLLTFLVAAALYPVHRGQSRRLAAVSPLLVLSWLGSTVALFVIGWSPLPSTAADLAGPSAGALTAVDLAVEMDGFLVVGVAPGDDLYSVALHRSGGRVGAPQALERIVQDQAQVAVGQRPESGWFRTSGWDLMVNNNVVWAMDLNARDIEADLGALTISTLTVAGDGRIEVGVAVDEVEVRLAGKLELSVPLGTAVRVVGQADVPSNWLQTEDGYQSNSNGTGYVVLVAQGADVSVGYGSG